MLGGDEAFQQPVVDRGYREHQANADGRINRLSAPGVCQVLRYQGGAVDHRQPNCCERYCYEQQTPVKILPGRSLHLDCAPVSLTAPGFRSAGAVRANGYICNQTGLPVILRDLYDNFLRVDIEMLGDDRDDLILEDLKHPRRDVRSVVSQDQAQSLGGDVSAGRFSAAEYVEKPHRYSFLREPKSLWISVCF